MTLKEMREQFAPLIRGTAFEGRSWFAGGCVRDEIMQADTPILGDADITVELPQGGLRLADHLYRKLGGKKPQLHREFFTATLSINGLNLEFVATRREEYKPKSRYPLVYPGTLLDDVLRRDFTINALLMSISTGEIADFCECGMCDLGQGLIRCLGEPKTKFNEDPLRMLRALRFALRFSFKLEEATREALISQATALNRLSRRLIGMELDKMMQRHEPEVVHNWLRELHWDGLSRLNNVLTEVERERI